MPSATGHDARALLLPAGRVVIDGHPICAECGAAVAPTEPAGTWRHVPAGRAYPRRSRWLDRVTWPELRTLQAYADFTARYPWTVHPEVSGGAVTSEQDWREGVRRLASYHAGLARARRLRRLRPADNPYAELLLPLSGGTVSDPPAPALTWAVSPGLANVLDLPARRRELVSLFSWAIPSDGALAVLGRYGPIAECGAGSGYWAALLRARGVDVLAYDCAPTCSAEVASPDVASPDVADPGNAFHRDPHGPWTRLDRLTSARAAAAHPDRALLLCWPPHDDDGASYAALRAYRGDTLLYVGEGPGGPTGSVRFHREVELNWTPVEQVDLPHWPGMRDRLVVYQRSGGPRRPMTRRDRCTECRRFVSTGWVGRCDRCFRARPPALALQVAGRRVEYPADVVAAMPPGLRRALEQSAGAWRVPCCP